MSPGFLRPLLWAPENLGRLQAKFRSAPPHSLVLRTRGHPPRAGPAVDAGTTALKGHLDPCPARP